MKPTLILALIALMSSVLGAAEKSDLTLETGRLLKAARIVGISNGQAMIVHQGGTETVPADDVPLDVLARAHMELKAQAEKKKKQTAEMAKVFNERTAAAKEKKDEEIRLRLAAAAARERAQIAPPGGSAAAAGTVRDVDRELAALKTQFPAKRKQSVTVHIGGKRPRSDQLEIEVPSGDLWTWYRGMVQTTTLQALPVTLKRINERIERDLADLAQRGSLKDEAAQAQARHSTQWINGELRSYLSQLQGLM
jgi:hypothetical protein